MTGTDVLHAADLLRAGEIVAIPTETVYGLAANALEEKAVIKIFEAKNRPFFDPLIVHIGHLDQMHKLVAHFPEKAKQLANAFWPGPLTIVLPKSFLIPDIVTSGLPFVGIRMPDHPVLQQLFAETDLPLAAPSANPFGYVSPTTAQHVEEQLGDKIPYILDGGPCAVGVESTIISLADPDDPILLRYGGIELEKISDLIGHVSVQVAVGSNPNSPGQLDKHYATSKEIILMNPEDEKPEGDFTTIGFGGEGVFDINLSKSGSLSEAATHLFAALREADKSPKPTILIERVPDTGLGKAINDRLNRAARR
ncbi:MAG: threonylcarbamoyl-AMP synthase [Bacteroidetes bacterium]|nr:threonylcarbamoyl-AMP synthase [Bacteroidota bacterium]